MKASEVRKLSDKELVSEIDKLSKERLTLRIRMANSQGEKTHRLSQIKKSVARCLTILRERKAKS